MPIVNTVLFDSLPVLFLTPFSLSIAKAPHRSPYIEQALSHHSSAKILPPNITDKHGDFWAGTWR
jgi:hypothetical protein